ncbi:Efb1 [Kluyveromyces lactis]|nr:Efb1 [Kluyveromyces lactis]
MSFSDFSKVETLQKLNTFLADKSYIEGNCINIVLLLLKLTSLLSRLSNLLTQNSPDGSTTLLPRLTNSNPCQLLLLLQLLLKKKMMTMTKSICSVLTMKSMKKLNN